MDLKLSQIVNAQQALQNLIQQPLPIRASSYLRKLIKKINPEIISYNEAKIKKGEELGTLNSDGSRYDIKPENIDTFNKEDADALESIVTVEVPYISVGMLERANVFLSTADMMMLDWLIVEENSELLKSV